MAESIRIATVSWSFTDDIVFNNPALILFASGCKWACPGCHNKALQCFESSTDLKFASVKDAAAYVCREISKNKALADSFTIVGSGGDFFFQARAWAELARDVKNAFPDTKIIWYTGADYTPENIVLLAGKFGDIAMDTIDAILWGRLSTENGMVVKYLSESRTHHAFIKKILTGEYNSNFEKENI